MAVLTVKDIVEQVIKQIGADGLCSKDDECGCLLEDLAPCDCLTEHCAIAKANTKGAPEAGFDFFFQVINFGDLDLSVTLTKRLDENDNTNS